MALSAEVSHSLFMPRLYDGTSTPLEFTCGPHLMMWEDARRGARL
jgi:hypothetical protein